MRRVLLLGAAVYFLFCFSVQAAEFGSGLVELAELRTPTTRIFDLGNGVRAAVIYLEPMIDGEGPDRGGKDGTTFLIPGGMTYVRSAQPDTQSWSGNATAYIGHNDDADFLDTETLVNKADMSLIAGERIGGGADAVYFTAEIFENDLTAQTSFDLYNNAGTFAESSVTWNSKPAVDLLWATATADVGDVNTWLKWDGLRMVLLGYQSGYYSTNEGFTIRSQIPANGFIRIRSEDTGTNNKPYFFVTYIDPTDAHDTCATALDITSSGTDSADTTQSSNNYFVSLSGDDGMYSADTVYVWTPAAGGIATVDVTAETSFDVIFYVRSSDCESGETVAYANETGANAYEETADFAVAGGASYYIFVDGHDTQDATNLSEGAFDISVVLATTTTVTTTTSATTTTGADDDTDDDSADDSADDAADDASDDAGDDSGQDPDDDEGDDDTEGQSADDDDNTAGPKGCAC